MKKSAWGWSILLFLVLGLIFASLARDFIQARNVPPVEISFPTPRVKLPQVPTSSLNGSSDFRGPIGKPFVIGPPGPPPNY